MMKKEPYNSPEAAFQASPESHRQQRSALLRMEWGGGGVLGVWEEEEGQGALPSRQKVWRRPELLGQDRDLPFHYRHQVPPREAAHFLPHLVKKKNSICEKSLHPKPPKGQRPTPRQKLRILCQSVTIPNEYKKALTC